MKNVLRAFLPALGVLSMLVFSSPAAAGMVSTPRAAAGEEPGREAALAILKSRLAEAPEAAAGLDRLPTSELRAIAGAVQALDQAAGHGNFDGRLILWTIGILIVLWWLAFDRDRYHRYCH